MPINITMPALSPTMEEGNLAKWHVKEGDTVESGDVIAEIETDKATMEVEAVDEGVIGKIIINEGTQGVKVNEIIAVLLEDGESANDIGDVSSTAPSSTEPAKASEEKTTDKQAPKSSSNVTQTATNAQTGSRIFASPLAKRIAANKGIDLTNIKGSGPRGRIVKADVENAKAVEATNTAPSAVHADPNVKTNVFGMAYKEIPNNNIRKVVAKRLSESKQTVPHFYLTVECTLDALLAARKEINDKANGAYKLSVNDFIIKAAAMALKAYPDANVSWNDDAIHQFLDADISVAVSTPTGLITPIVKAAQNKGLKDISTEMKDLAGRARENKLKPEELQGGPFSFSNLGMFGVKEFAAIVNPPQGAILAIGAGEQRAVPVNGNIEIKTVMNCTLSVDHRCIDGAVGAEYLQIFKQFIENPVSMLV